MIKWEVVKWAGPIKEDDWLSAETNQYRPPLVITSPWSASSGDWLVEAKGCQIKPAAC